MSQAQCVGRRLPCTHEENHLVVGFEVRVDEQQHPDAVRLLTDPKAVRTRLRCVPWVASTYSSLMCDQFLQILYAKADGLAAGEAVASRR